MSLVATLKASPVWAAASKSVAGTARRSNSQDLRALLASRTGPAAGKASLLQKIFLGVNAKGKLGNWRVGDTRTELSMLLNGLSMLAILGVWAAGAYVVQKREEHMDLVNLRKEVLREQEYRENMYFEAVEEIQTRLADPKLKSGARAGLQRQLRELDPEGRVRDFLAGKSARPDVHVLGNRDKNALKGSPSEGRAASSIRSRSSDPAASEGDEGLLEDDENEGGEVNIGAGGNAGAEKRHARPAVSATGSDQLGRGGRHSGRERDRASDREQEMEDRVRPESLFEREAGELGTDAARILQTLEVLDGALRQVALDKSGRDKVTNYLMHRFEGVYADPAKRRVALQKLQERLEDVEYWQELAKEL